MRTRLPLALVLLLLTGALPIAVAQPTSGSCTLGRTQKTLDVNNVAACVSNTGLLFRCTGTAEGYEVPRGNGLGSYYRASLWVGGTVCTLLPGRAAIAADADEE